MAGAWLRLMREESENKAARACYVGGLTSVYSRRTTERASRVDSGEWAAQWWAVAPELRY